MTRLHCWLVARWRRPTLASRLLLTPLAGVFALAVRGRRVAYARGWLAARRLPVPVIVVGNLTVGGSGKTPLVIHLVRALQTAGFTAGVVSRGYGGSSGSPRRLESLADPAAAGDEPVLIQWATGCPVAVGGERAAAAACLLPDCDVIVADDGLQHYALARTLEIAVVDGLTGLGNGRLLPAGPLREPPARLDEVDFVVVRDGEYAGARRIEVAAGLTRRLDGEGEARPLADWADIKVHAVAAIGVPERFFAQLEAAGLVIERHAFTDHHAFTAADFVFADDHPVLMTPKDAVKCRGFNDPRLWWVEAVVTDRDDLAGAVITRLRTLAQP